MQATDCRFRDMFAACVPSAAKLLVIEVKSQVGPDGAAMGNQIRLVVCRHVLCHIFGLIQHHAHRHAPIRGRDQVARKT